MEDHRIMKKFIAGFCAAAIAAGCLGVTAMADTETTDKLVSYEATSDNVKLIGRTYRKGDSTILGYSASGVEFKCTGTKAVFNVNGSAGPARFGVFVNGKLAKQGYIKNSKTDAIEVALPEGECTVKLIKLSEAAQSVTAIESIEVDGKIQPTEKAKHSIEFIGDSITCGYGVETALGKEQFSIYNENAAKTYAYKTAQNFGADYSFVSVSGAGVISGYTNGKDRNESLLVPDFYDKLCFTWSWFNGEEVAKYDWDFSQYQPELVVVNLGTNDNSYTKNDETKCAEFAKGYVDFIKEIREKNPNAEILCTLGLMGQELYPSIEKAVADYTAETGDSKVKATELSVQDSNANGFAVDYHPAAASHKTAADELTKAISDIYGWETVDPVDDGVDAMTKDNDENFDKVVEISSSTGNSSEEAKPEGSSSEPAKDSSTVVSSSSAATTNTNSTTNPNSSSNPNTDAAMGIGIGLAALAGAAMIATKRKK